MLDFDFDSTKKVKVKLRDSRLERKPSLIKWLSQTVDIKAVKQGKARVYLVKLLPDPELYSPKQLAALKELIQSTRRKKEISSDNPAKLIFAVETTLENRTYAVYVGDLSLIDGHPDLLEQLENCSAVEIIAETDESDEPCPGKNKASQDTDNGSGFWDV